MWIIGFFLQAFINHMIVFEFPENWGYFTAFISYLALVSYLFTALKNQGIYRRNMMVADCQNHKE